MKVSLIILTLNEIVGLREIFPQIPLSSVDEVLAIDGGSTDGTIEFFRSANIPVHIQTVRGRGEAFRLAFEKGSGDALIFFSPDGNENPADIPRFRPFLEKGYDIVIANRMSNGGHNEEDIHILKFRKWANNGFTLAANLTWNRDSYVYDTINGYRAITRPAWERLSPDGPGYTIEYQSSIRAFKHKLRIAEFPTAEGQRVDNRIGSPSVQTGIAFVKMYFRELFTTSAL